MSTLYRHLLSRCAPGWLAASVLTSLVASASAGPVRYRVADLGDFFPAALNDRGQVAGYLSGAVASHAALYDNGSVRDLGTLGGDDSYAFAINNAGHVVGESETADEDREAGTIQRAFLYADGRLRDMGAPWWADETQANAINDAGQVVGEGQRVLSWGQAFLYSDGVYTDLHSLTSAVSSHAADINNAGVVVGSAGRGGGPARAFRYQDGTVEYLEHLPGSDFSNAVAVNEGGQIVGISGTDAGSEVVLWEGGTVRRLATPGGGSASPAAINDAGQVVGTASSADSVYGFLYADGQMADLNDLIAPESGWRVDAAWDINGSGWIAATGINLEGEYHGVLLVPTDDGPGPNPIPLPPAAWTGLAVFAGITYRYKRRASATGRVAAG